RVLLRLVSQSRMLLDYIHDKYVDRYRSIIKKLNILR
ncbi:30S ribosomal protein S15, partial [Francisella tularensis subsp. holarctica]|nr:30S ribosomal protein S15 [Francisella tularensis subsp. holarctica]